MSVGKLLNSGKKNFSFLIYKFGEKKIFKENTNRWEISKMMGLKKKF